MWATIQDLPRSASAAPGMPGIALPLTPRNLTAGPVRRLATSISQHGHTGHFGRQSGRRVCDVETGQLLGPQMATLGREYQQLPYSQTALLNFRGQSFPHVTIGTLVKAF